MKQYDLFISYKSADRDIADKIRNGLIAINPDIKIFWSENTLAEIGQSDYADAIENAIACSRNMVVVGSSVENITSKWVSFEWHLFRHYQLNDNENYYNNLFLAIDELDVKKLPGALQICECIKYYDYEKIHKYCGTKIVKHVDELQRGFGLIRDMFENIGWRNSVFVTPEQLSEYEASISGELRNVTIISHSLLQDAPGGALFNTVKDNLSRGVNYNYIFLNASQAYGILRRIQNGHSAENRKYLKLEIAEDSFWVLGNYANVTIYEFNDNRASEGFLRILIETSERMETPVYLRMSESFVDNLWNSVEQYRMKGMIKRYGE